MVELKLIYVTKRSPRYQKHRMGIDPRAFAICVVICAITATLQNMCNIFVVTKVKQWIQYIFKLGSPYERTVWPWFRNDEIDQHTSNYSEQNNTQAGVSNLVV